VSELTPYTMFCDGDLGGYNVHVYDSGPPPVTPVQFWFTDRTSAIEWLESRGREIYGDMIRVENVQAKAVA
jgi:hypothetical protein